MAARAPRPSPTRPTSQTIGGAAARVKVTTVDTSPSAADSRAERSAGSLRLALVRQFSAGTPVARVAPLRAHHLTPLADSLARFALGCADGRPTLEGRGASRPLNRKACSDKTARSPPRPRCAVYL